MNRQITKRLFFALWPSHHTRDAIYKVERALQKQTDGRLVKVENLHITLAFVGSVTEEQQQCMKQVASNIQLPSFNLVLSELGYWPKPKVAWLAPKQTPGGLINLANSLNANLEACGYEADKRPFHAHITLLRKAKRHPKETQTREIDWSVDRFALVESITHQQGVEYQVITEWPLLAQV